MLKKSEKRYLQNSVSLQPRKVSGKHPLPFSGEDEVEIRPRMDPPRLEYIVFSAIHPTAPDHPIGQTNSDARVPRELLRRERQHAATLPRPRRLGRPELGLLRRRQGLRLCLSKGLTRVRFELHKVRQLHVY